MVWRPGRDPELMEAWRSLAAHLESSLSSSSSSSTPAPHAPSSSSSSSSSYGGDDGDLEKPLGTEFEIPLAVLILLLYIVLGHSLEMWKEMRAERDAAYAHAGIVTQHKRSRFLCTFHESGPAILLGLAVGLMMNYGADQQFDFNADIFFYAVLPPIIFHQGYALKKRNFFKFFTVIFSFGILGTLIQFSVIAAMSFFLTNIEGFPVLRDDGVPIGLTLHESMLVASIFSAADEVATLSLIKQDEYPKLAAVLFGEGVLNDAMSILLFRVVMNMSREGGTSKALENGPMLILELVWKAVYLLVTSGASGSAVGLAISLLLKNVPSLQSSPVRQTAILMLGGYFSFCISEALELSGILAVFFCGLTLSHYAWHSLGSEAQTTSKITSETISMIAEAYCFAAIGLSVHEFDASQWCASFTLLSIVSLMTARAIAIYGTCLVGRFFDPKQFKIPLAEQNVLFFGGLVRGAISWAQVVQVGDAHHGMLVTTTLGVVVFTVVIFGAVMPFFTGGLQPETEHVITSNIIQVGGGNPLAYSVLTVQSPARGETVRRGSESCIVVHSPNRGEFTRRPTFFSATGGGSLKSSPRREGETARLIPQRKRPVTPTEPGSAFTAGEMDRFLSNGSQHNGDSTVPRGVMRWTGQGEAPAPPPPLERQTPSKDIDSRVHRAWILFDNKFMRPVFGGALHSIAGMRSRRGSHHVPASPSAMAPMPPPSGIAPTTPAYGATYNGSSGHPPPHGNAGSGGV
jgi:NhaP-type Na+/H+ or K+/H+ antiporter